MATDSGFTDFVPGYNGKDVANVTSFAVTGLSAGTSYYYRVRAYSAVGASDYSKAVTVATLPPTFILNVTIDPRAGSGGGSVHSAPSGISCLKGGNTGCNASNDYGTSVSLTATPDWKSLFSSWSGDCNGYGNPCSVLMTKDRNVSAAFIPNHQVRLQGALQTDYATIQEGYDDAVNNSTIMAQVYNFHENLIFDKDIKVLVGGGRNSSYQTTAGYTTVQGTLLIQKGSVAVSRLKIR